MQEYRYPADGSYQKVLFPLFFSARREISASGGIRLMKWLLNSFIPMSFSLINVFVKV